MQSAKMPIVDYGTVLLQERGFLSGWRESKPRFLSIKQGLKRDIRRAGRTRIGCERYRTLVI